MPSQPSQNTLDADLVSASELIPHLPFSLASLYVLTRCGQFPPATNLGLRKMRWRRSDVDQWLIARGLNPLPTA